MKEWIRSVFGKIMPTYGVCGGAQKDCVIQHFDPLDKAFFAHDNELNEAKSQEDRDAADKKLYEALKKLKWEDMKKIKWYQIPYGYAFRFCAMQVFKPRGEK